MEHTTMGSRRPRPQARLDALLSATHGVVWGLEVTGWFLPLGPSWERYTGQGSSDSRGYGWLDVVHWEDRTAMVEAWQLARRSRSAREASCRLWHLASGSYRPVLVRLAPVQSTAGAVGEWVASAIEVEPPRLEVVDPQTRRLNEDLLATLDAQVKERNRLLRSCFDVVLQLDGECRIIGAEASVKRVLGLPAPALLGRPFTELFPADAQSGIEATLDKLLRGDSDHAEFETPMVNPTGASRCVAWRVLAGAGPTRLHAVGRDVTHQRSQMQQLLQAQRIEALGRLTHSVAHSFNNVLATTLGNVEAARRRTEDEQVRRLLMSAAESVRKGTALLDQLLAIGRRREYALEPVPVNEVVLGVRDALQRAAGSNVQLRLALDSHVGAARADPQVLERVLLELAENARDAMPHGGELEVVTAPARAPGGAQNPAGGEFVCLAVADSGQGMDDETLERCLEPFFTTKGVRGTGLGLPQALSFARECGGSINVDSRVAKGTRVEILLPAVDVDATGADHSLHDHPSDQAVLVVDDDPDVLDSTSLLVEYLGHQPLRASSAAEALELVRDRTVPVMLTDISMPAMDGFELIARARALRPSIVCVVMTADTKALEQARDGDPLFALSKPFSEKELARALAAAFLRAETNTSSTWASATAS